MDNFQKGAALGLLLEIMEFKRESKTRMPRKGAPRRVVGVHGRVFDNMLTVLNSPSLPTQYHGAVLILDPVAHLMFLICTEVVEKWEQR